MKTIKSHIHPFSLSHTIFHPTKNMESVASNAKSRSNCIFDICSMKSKT